MRSMSQTRVLEALRALLGAIGSEEIQARADIARLEEGAKTGGTEVDRLLWQVRRSRKDAAEAVGLPLVDLPEGKLCVDVLRRTAAERLARLSKVDSADLQGNVAELRVLHGRDGALPGAQEDEVRALLRGTLLEVRDVGAEDPYVWVPNCWRWAQIAVTTGVLTAAA